MPRRFLNGLDLANQRITSLADPSGPTDAVTKQYSDAQANGRDWKESVRAATTANITLSGAQTIDGVAVVAGDRVLVKDQTTGSANGIYVAAAGAWSRAGDAGAGQLTAGSTTSVTEGTVNGDKRFVLTTNDPITVGTTALVWTVDAGGGTTYTGGNGITVTGSSIAVNPAAGGGIAVAAGGVSLDTAVAVRKYAVSIGNGALTSIAVTHNLGTRDVTVGVYDNTTFEEVIPDIVHTDVNNVTLTFATAPAASAYRAVVHG